MRPRVVSIVLAYLIVAASTFGFSATGVPRTAEGSKGMVVSASPIASQVGLDVLIAGGNAVDAAVAVAFALAVTYPAAGNLGGGGFLLLHRAEDGLETTLDFRETAPLRSTPEMYLDASGKAREGLSTRGHLASGVPGSVAGLHQAWMKYGSAAWPSLVEPSVRLAENGFEISSELAQSLKNSQKLLQAHPGSSRAFLRDGNLFRPGEKLIQPELARTLKTIAKSGPEAFYRGEIADLIVREMEQGGGLISRQDLAEYQVKERPPVRGVYRDCEIVSMGPPSSGGIILVEMLNMAERFDVQALPPGLADELMLKAAIGQRAFRDRSNWLGDGDFVELPVERLMSKDYASGLAASIRLDEFARLPMEQGAAPLSEREETTHLSVVDSRGNAVALTTTLNGSFGSGVMVRGAGFLLNNEMDDFASAVNRPNMFGLVQGSANAIAPRKRPLSSMTPTIVKRDGKPWLVLGSPGGPTIISTVFQILLNVVDHGMGLADAVAAPRAHHQWLPDELFVENGSLSEEAARELERRGLKTKTRTSMGDAQCIMLDPKSKALLGVADPRNDGAAKGM